MSCDDAAGNAAILPSSAATNFTAAFSKVCSLGIKKNFDDNDINYNRFTVVQALDLKASLELLNIKRKEVTIVSIDAVEMYRQSNTSWLTVSLPAHRVARSRNGAAESVHALLVLALHGKLRHVDEAPSRGLGAERGPAKVHTLSG